MARNEEKALTLFSKWDTFKSQQQLGDGGAQRRPFMSSECTSLAEAEKWRRELLRDLTKKVSQIQNAGLGEHRLRELNDEINKLNRTKHHWDKRVVELGGSDGRQKTYIDVDGKELPGEKGYKYYGAAKDLPGVRELFQQNDADAEARRRKRTRGDMYKNITPDYYGYRDDDDGVLMPQEAAREEELIRIAVRERNEKKHQLREEVKRSGGHFGAAELALLEAVDEENETEDSVLVLASKYDLAARASATTNAEVRAHVVVPSQLEIGSMLVDHKKRQLLEQFL
jgi:pre-mRNA-splicing factor ISY1